MTNMFSLAAQGHPTPFPAPQVQPVRLPAARTAAAALRASRVPHGAAHPAAQLSLVIFLKYKLVIQ